MDPALELVMDPALELVMEPELEVEVDRGEVAPSSPGSASSVSSSAESVYFDAAARRMLRVRWRRRIRLVATRVLSVGQARRTGRPRARGCGKCRLATQ